MTRQRILRFCLALLLIGALGAAGLYWWTRPQVVHAGKAVVLVDGREIHLTGYAEAGQGILGTLGLVADRCVGLVGDDPQDGTVIVWPPGTSVEGSGDDLTITSEGVTVHLGDSIVGGTLDQTQWPEFDGKLPQECSGFPLVDVGLGS